VSDCAAIESDLTAFFDGELEGEAADRVAAHLEACPRCRARMDDLERVEAPLRAIEPPQVAVGEWSRCWGVIEAAIASDETPTAASSTGAGEPTANPGGGPAPRPELRLVVRDGAREANAAARLVRLLIPLAAAASIALATYAASTFRAHAEALDDASRVALVGLASTGDEP
jgi:anti-sigma factor RsiW